MDLEKRIAEQRTTEAIKKNLMGYEGKIFLISKFLGQELVKQNEEAESYDFDSIYEIPEENTFPTFSDESYSYSIGHSFDGLGYGYHLNILFVDYETSIKLWHEGYLKYHEEAGNILLYNPNGDWERIVNNLFEIAELKIKEKIKQFKIEEKKSFANLKNHELQRIRDKWGDIL